MTRKFLVALGLVAVLAQAALAWQPNGWVYAEWPFAYDVSSADWYWFDAGSEQWVHGFEPAEGWNNLGSSGLAEGWCWYAWPYGYSQNSNAWYYVNESNTQWCANMRTAGWARWGEAAAPGPTGFVEQDGVVSMEAEHYTTQTGYGLYANANASGGEVMRADGSGPSLNFEFTVAQGGRWYIWIRAYATANENNGMYLNLNGASLRAPGDHPLAGARDIYLTKNGWNWAQQWLSGESHQGPVTMDIAPGTHVLSIVKRKVENPLIDKVVLTRTNQAPAGYGPAETVTLLPE